MPSTNSLRPIIPNNASPSRITAAAGTRLAGTSFSIQVIIFIDEITLQPGCTNATLFCLPHSRSITRSSFRSLPKIPHCWLKKPDPYLSVSVAGRPLRPAKDLRLGKLLPYQLPNPPRTHPKSVVNFLIRFIAKWFLGTTLSLKKNTIILKFKVDFHVLRTRSLCKNITFNSHVLSMLPAFILSQDQTQIYHKLT